MQLMSDIFNQPNQPTNWQLRMPGGAVNVNNRREQKFWFSLFKVKYKVSTRTFLELFCRFQ